MLVKLLQDYLKEHNLSVREAAKQIGLANTTLERILDGMPPSLETTISICNWMGINVASVLNSRGVGQDKLAAEVALILEQTPELIPVFEEAFHDLDAGNLSVEDLREIVSYVAFRKGKRSKKKNGSSDILQKAS